MKGSKHSIFRNIIYLIKKNKYMICIIFVFIFIFLFFYYEHDRIYIILLGSMFLLIIFIIFGKIKLIRQNIIFNENELIILENILRINIDKKIFIYKNINKFIIGRFYNHVFSEKRIYAIYIDNNDKIEKIYTLQTYKKCLEIIEEIKNKTGKKIYDDTDNIYTQEEDLFRNYYKLKKTFEEIKHE